MHFSVLISSHLWRHISLINPFSYRHLIPYFHLRSSCKLLAFCFLIIVLLSPIAESYLIFANRKDIRKLDENFVTQKRQFNTSVIKDGLEDAAAIDFDYENKIIFWTDAGFETIRGIRFSNGHTFDVITSGIVSPDGLACDWVTKKLYWADSETNRIEVSHYDGTYRTVLFWKDLDQPRAIVLVPSDGLMFWSDWGEVPKIERASMDGNNSTRQVIIKERIFWPNGLTVDYQAKKLYWADAKLGHISSVDFDGQNQRTVSSGNLSHLFALTLHGDILYWTDWIKKGIHSCNKTTGVRERAYINDALSPMGLTVFDASRQPKSSTPCDTNNGGCSHLCLLSSLSPFYSCSCPTGVKLMEDGKSCRTSAEKILLLARRIDIRRISLDTNDYTAVVLPIRGIKHAIAVDYDTVDGKVYWTDDDLHVIKRAMLDGGQPETIIETEVDHPDGIAIDWIARNIYWTDAGTDRIEVARLDGSSRKILLTEDLDQPRAIVVHPEEGIMFWTDWGANAKIERAALDGTDRLVIVNSSLIWPNGLAIDFELSNIYWCDAKTDKIEMARFDGTGRRVILSDQLPHLFGFTLLNEWVYWSDWQRRSVERAHKLTGKDRETIVDQLPDLMGLKAVSVNKTKGTNPCADQNGNCTHLCLNRPHNDYVCACPRGYELTTDLRACIIPEAYMLILRKNDMRRMSFKSQNFEILLSGLQSASSFDVDISENYIYWTDSKHKTISRSFVNGSGIEYIVMQGLEAPESLAVDWIAKNIYWTDIELKRIEVARCDGSFRRALFHDHNKTPHSIAVNPIEGYLFWSDWSSNGRIERSFLDGDKKRVIIDSVGRATSLTIDYKGERLYWISMNGDSSQIVSSMFDGSSKLVLLNDGSTRPNALAFYDDYIYFSDRTSKTIEFVHKSNATDRNLFKKDDMFASDTDLFVYHILYQYGWNFCAVNNGGCEHLCFTRPNIGQRSNQPEVHCSCAAHYTLSNEGSCSPPESFLLFSQKNLITRFLFDREHTKIDFHDVLLPISNVKNIAALAYDQVDNYIYWIDGRMKAIKRTYINGSGFEVIHSNHHSPISPVDLVIDPYARMLFWTCSLTNSINSTRLIGKPTLIGSIYHSNHDQPRLLAFHYKLNVLFWTNELTTPQIERISLPNLIKTTVVTGNFDQIVAIAVDQDLDFLLWSDSSSKSIEYSNLNGQYRRTLYKEPDLNPIAIASYSKYVFWIERDNKTIEKLPIDLNIGNNKQTIFSKVKNLTDIISVQRMKKNSSYLFCANENGGCSHICIISHTEHKAKCACPMGLILSADDKNCVEPIECSANEFRCMTGKCIRNIWRCNGTPECPTGSDEHNCPDCAINQFTCLKSANELACFDNRHICDGFKNCFDGYDELCCGKDEFRCNSRNCLSGYQLCDGKKDCLDGEDEDLKNCPKLSPTLPSTVSTKSTYSFLVIAAIILVIVISVFVLYQCKRYTNSNEEKEVGITDILMTEQRPIAGLANGIGISRSPHRGKFSGKKSILNNNRSKIDNCNTLTTTTTVSGLDIIPNNGLLGLKANTAASICPSLQSESLIERNVTGASSASSSAHNNYPRETTNPPPSPVTSSSSLFVLRSNGRNKNGGPSKSTNKSSNRRHKKSNWKSKPSNRGPPPTPCSTEVYEDVGHSKIKYVHYDDLRNDDFNYKPPPPTPRHYFSDQSCPPSPNITERSYCNPFPPPPSPVQESD